MKEFYIKYQSTIWRILEILAIVAIFLFGFIDTVGDLGEDVKKNTESITENTKAIGQFKEANLGFDSKDQKTEVLLESKNSLHHRTDTDVHMPLERKLELFAPRGEFDDVKKSIDEINIRQRRIEDKIDRLIERGIK